ncbi:MAG: protease modulator HflC [Zetaproteobacteria bacterium]|nr:MAG: protease modulator HflC [Zetaproteobacteria bacterium]
MTPKQMLLAIVAIALIGLVGSSAFIVDQREQALVLQFGNPVKVVKEAGLHFKLPWQSVSRFDRRLLESDAPVNEVITKDKKTILVDNYTRWKIIDPLKVYQVARDQRGVMARMDDVVRGKVREVLGQHTLHEIVSGGENANLRAELMLKIRDRAEQDVAAFGIHIEDVRIKRADLPPENSDAVYQRMKAERQRIAKEYRSEGEEAAKEIRAQAEKERKIILANAYRDAQIIRGQADAEATAIYASAHKLDPEFYAFLRSLNAYRASLVDQTRLIITPGSEFFHFFERSK